MWGKSEISNPPTAAISSFCVKIMRESIRLVSSDRSGGSDLQKVIRHNCEISGCELVGRAFHGIVVSNGHHEAGHRRCIGR